MKQLHFEERQDAIGEMIAKLLKESVADQQNMVMKNRRKDAFPSALEEVQLSGIRSVLKKCKYTSSLHYPTRSFRN